MGRNAWHRSQEQLPSWATCFTSDIGEEENNSLLPWFVGEGNGSPLQYSRLENPMNREAWKAAVHGITKSQTWLGDFTFTFHFHALEKEMATHSSVLAWRIPGTEEPGGLPSMGSHRVGHDWSDLVAVASAAMSHQGTQMSALWVLNFHNVLFF